MVVILGTSGRLDLRPGPHRPPPSPAMLEKIQSECTARLTMPWLTLLSSVPTGTQHDMPPSRPLPGQHAWQPCDSCGTLAFWAPLVDMNEAREIRASPIASCGYSAPSFRSAPNRPPPSQPAIMTTTNLFPEPYLIPPWAVSAPPLLGDKLTLLASLSGRTIRRRNVTCSLFRVHGGITSLKVDPWRIHARYARGKHTGPEGLPSRPRSRKYPRWLPRA